MENWLSFLYLYGVGGLLFSIPILLSIKKKSLSLKKTKDRRLLGMLIFGYVFYFVLQGGWQLWAIK